MYHVISQHGNGVCRFRHCRLRFHEAHGYSPKHTPAIELRGVCACLRPRSNFTCAPTRSPIEIIDVGHKRDESDSPPKSADGRTSFVILSVTIRSTPGAIKHKNSAFGFSLGTRETLRNLKTNNPHLSPEIVKNLPLGEPLNWIELLEIVGSERTSNQPRRLRKRSKTFGESSGQPSQAAFTLKKFLLRLLALNSLRNGILQVRCLRMPTSLRIE